METVGSAGAAWLAVLELLKIVWRITQRTGRFLLAWKPVLIAFKGQEYGWVWRGAAARQASCAPSASREEQVLNLWMPDFPSDLIPE